jgi:predicted metal-dependent phosphotriesterase family hydrolase
MVKENKTDSVAHHEERHAKMKAESEDVAQRQSEDQEIASSGVLVHVDETREQLLDRIRKMREIAHPSPAEIPLSEGQQKQLDAEQEAGRQAVAKAEKAAEANRKAIEAATKAEGEKK